MSKDDRLRYRQESRGKFLFDLRWDKICKFKEDVEKRRQEGIEEGRQEGMQKGRREEIEEVVLNMLENDFDLDSISKATKPNKKKIKKIQG